MITGHQLNGDCASLRSRPSLPLVLRTLRLPESIWAALKQHLADLRERYLARGWQLFHEVNLLDIDIDLGDVMPMTEVLAHLQTRATTQNHRLV